VGDKIIPRQTSEIACVISENKGTYIICKDGSRYAVNPSLDELSGSLDPLMFFRISRSAIISKTEVLGAERQPSGKLVLETKLSAPLEVSRARVDDFLSWLEN
jgi:DNA-binding LytR/AlgR family response regulator